MKLNFKLTQYNKKMGHSYTLGTFPTIELLKAQPQHVHKILIHSACNSDTQLETITSLCEQYTIPYEINNRAIERIRVKENCLVVGVFYKYISNLMDHENHVLLVNPSDMGNMGTIIRTCIGFGVSNLAIIDPGVDLFHPKVIRASMGSLFHLQFTNYSSFEHYRKDYPSHKFYAFMTNGKTDSTRVNRPKDETFTAIFGNESSGLDDAFLNVGTSVYIRHSPQIDSLNLAVSVGIGLYELTK